MIFSKNCRKVIGTVENNWKETAWIKSWNYAIFTTLQPHWATQMIEKDEKMTKNLFLVK